MIRYRYVERRILSFLKSIDKQLLTYPLNIIRIIQNIPELRLWSYQYYAKTHLCTIGDVIKLCNSKSGCIIGNQCSKQFLILFNNAMPPGHVLWTLAHELGHYLLCHTQTNISSEEVCSVAENELIQVHQCKEMEQEADYFAATLLSPFPLYKKLNINSSLDIQRVFALSTEASINRMAQYSKWKDKHYKRAFDSDIISLFTPWIIEQQK